MEYEALYRDWRDQSLKTWSQMMNPEACVQAAGASADLFMAGQRKMLEATQHLLDSSEMPNRQDVARLEQLVGLAEARAQAAEARLQEAVSRVEALEAQVRQVKRKK